MILLWGSMADIPITKVARSLKAMNVPFFTIDARRALETEIELTVDDTGMRGHALVRGQRYDWADVTAVYVRPPDPMQAPAVLALGEGSPAYQHAIALHEAVATFTELSKARVVNRVSAMGSNSSKPYQVSLIERSGFAIPDTLVTTEPELVPPFVKRHQDVIYKSVSGVRSIVARLTPEKMQRVSNLASCPTQFQRYIPGTDFRVHVIGERVFTARVECSVLDYRYAGREGKSVQLTPYELSETDAKRCVDLARSLNLEMAGIDLRQTPDGEWVCFEVNPSPAFTFYELEGHNMSDCVAELLASGAAMQRSPS
jgi:glutathione synthase/RimK-type ligase-like ATP-grasp enzyme